MIIPPSDAMNSSSPDSASKSESQSGWSPGDVGTIVFGCIVSVLGVLNLCLPFRPRRQRFRLIVGDGFQVELELQNLP